MSGAGTPWGVRVADGSPDPELERRGVVLRPSPGALPLHVREPDAVRWVLRDMAVAGADTLTAPTGDLHRRALGRIGAARRSREWIQAAIDLAREARDEAAEAAATGSRPDDVPAGPVPVGGLVLPLEGTARPGEAPDRSTASSEHRAHAGMLAESGADFLRIESMTTIVESEAATVAALEVGLETWSGVQVDASGLALPSGEELDRWADVVGSLRPTVLTVVAPTDDAAAIAIERLAGLGAGRGGSGEGPDGHGTPPGGRRWESTSAPVLCASVQDPESVTVTRLIAAGADLLSAGSDGSPSRVAALRAAVAAEVDLRSRRRHEEQEMLVAWVGLAADRASGGPALWLAVAGTPRARPGWLPPRFAWDVAPREQIARLPRERYRLLIGGGDVAAGALMTATTGAAGHRGAVTRGGAATGAPAIGAIGATDPLTPAEARRLVSSVEPGGWLLLAPGIVAPGLLAADDRLESIAPAPEGEIAAKGWIARRRP